MKAKAKLLIAAAGAIAVDEQGRPRVPDAEALAKFQPLERINTDQPGHNMPTTTTRTSNDGQARRRQPDD